MGLGQSKATLPSSPEQKRFDADVGDFLAALFGLQPLTPAWLRLLHHPHPQQVLPQLPVSLSASLQHDLLALPDLSADLDRTLPAEVAQERVAEWLQDPVGLSSTLLNWIGHDPLARWNGHADHLVHLLETRLALLRAIHFILAGNGAAVHGQSESDRCHTLQCLFEGLLSLALPDDLNRMPPLLAYLLKAPQQSRPTQLSELLLQACNHAVCHASHAPLKALEWLWEALPHLHLSVDQLACWWYLVGRALLEAGGVEQGEGMGELRQNGQEAFYFDSPTSKLAQSLAQTALLPMGGQQQQQTLLAWMRALQAPARLSHLIRSNGQHVMECDDPSSFVLHHLVAVAQAFHSDWLVIELCRLPGMEDALLRRTLIATLINRREWEEAYAVLSLEPDAKLGKDAHAALESRSALDRELTRQLVCAMAEHGAEAALCSSLPWTGPQSLQVEQALRQRAVERERAGEAPNWHYLCYSFLATRHQHQAAGQALWEWLQVMRSDRAWQATRADYGLAEQAFTLRLAINSLCLAADDEQWVIDYQQGEEACRVLTVAELRKQARWLQAQQQVNCPDAQTLLARLLEAGQFELVSQLGEEAVLIEHLNGLLVSSAGLNQNKQRILLESLLEKNPLCILPCCQAWIASGHLPPRWLMTMLLKYDPDALVRLLCAHGHADVARTLMREYGTLALTPKSMLMLM